MLFLAFLFSFFVKIYADCSQLSFTAQYSVKNEFFLECSCVISVKNEISVSLDNVNCNEEGRFSLKETYIFVNGQKSANCESGSCDITAGTFFLKLHFVYSGYLNSYPVMVVIDNGYISFANGAVIQNKRTYYGKQIGKRYLDFTFENIAYCCLIILLQNEKR